MGLAGTAALLGGTGLGTARDDDSGFVRAVHAVPDGPAVDVLVDGQRILKAVEFPTVSGYFSAPPGTYDVRVVPSGRGRAAALVDARLTVEPGASLTVAAAGTAEDVVLERFRDRIERPERGTASVRVVHLSPDAPGFDIGVVDGPRLFRGVEFGEGSRYRPREPGTYDLEFRRGGTGRALERFNDVRLEADTVYSLFVVGLLDDDPEMSLLLAVDGEF